MSTGLLYHGFGLVGYNYVRAQYEGGVPSSLPLSISVTRFVVLFVRVAMWCFGAPSPGDSEQFP